MPASHTPGPWYAHTIGMPREPGAEYTFPLGTDPDVAVANARLIAAAPDLLEACEAALAFLADAALAKPIDGDPAMRACAATEAAISRATGREAQR